ncbi:DUF6975 family protein [Sphingomonas aracearum]|uniref:Uncharacterized protein n=1 Tax=Sphingomonas aracearum TaxID=2283317 RepID=A0A369VRX0_9SPHN|nr:hypothetical protein [Sphingomonas aracearum]RDE05124.1 hypothetical protein DVW87_07515 [Sphingomonas aracearum]
MNAATNNVAIRPEASVAALVATDGSASRAMVWQLTERGAAQRDLADAVHAFCSLHGRLPGMIEYAAARNTLAPATAWLTTAERGIGTERAYLARLTSAAGPLPSTPGQAETEAAIAGQRHALDMLAQSDRAGCALGAAAALILDWRTLRAVLDAAASRFGVESIASELPEPDTTTAMLAAATTSAGLGRAIGFGAQQLLAQHRGLWELLEARSSARRDT